MTDVTESVQPSNDGAKAEATHSKITFEHGGELYEIDPSDEWPVEAIERFEDGAVTTAARLILGPDGWETFKATSPKAKDVAPLIGAIQKAAGLSGN